MRLDEMWIRFYKSFNFDYEARARKPDKQPDWQRTVDGWLPHVRIRLEPDITAVVGSNESGKTHLLDAIHILLFDRPLQRRDFCRYSTLFSVEKGERLFPDIGGRFSLSDLEKDALQDADIPLQRNGTLLVFRTEDGLAVVSGDERIDLSAEQAGIVRGHLPHPRELKTNTPLPDSVPLTVLAGKTDAVKDRRARVEIFRLLGGITTEAEVPTKTTGLWPLLSIARPMETPEQRLGRLLLTKVANIDPSSFVELIEAIEEEREGLVNGLIQEMNASIARHLNISRWWTQDPDFQLRVSPREHELVFTIRDRTGTDYSFTERSRGLTYFLSYYVQLLSEDPPAGKAEILLMDEPDAYLSASGQQDLLRVLEHHARPETSDRVDQVVYVTHSPFLINRNAGHRVRVVDKGSRDEGTRLVKDATQNHYEPLRTSLGAFVAETAFIGGDNLFVEGIADQILLAGVNTQLLRHGTAPSQCLDLNRATIVPCGSSIPYMIFLARGRDQVKPACVALLDGDAAGQTTKRQLKRGGAHNRQILREDLVVTLDATWAAAAGLRVTEGVVVEEIEDLIPIQVVVEAGRRFAMRLLGVDEAEAKAFTEDAVRAGLEHHRGSTWNAAEEAFAAAFDSSLTKAGLAKEVVSYFEETAGSNPRPAGIPALESNFSALIRELASTLDRARDQESNSRRDNRVDRIIDTFIEDHPSGCIRDKAVSTLNRIDAAADDSDHGDAIRARTAHLRRAFKLAIDPLTNVDGYDEFLLEFKALRYVDRLEHQDSGAAVTRPSKPSKSAANGTNSPERPG